MQAQVKITPTDDHFAQSVTWTWQQPCNQKTLTEYLINQTNWLITNQMCPSASSPSLRKTRHMTLQIGDEICKQVTHQGHVSMLPSQ